MNELKNKWKLSTSLKRKRNVGSDTVKGDDYKGRGNGIKKTRKDLIQEIADYEGGVVITKSVKSKTKPELLKILEQKQTSGVQKFQLIIPEIDYPGLHSRDSWMD